MIEEEEFVIDFSKKGLVSVPDIILNQFIHVECLYLQDNYIATLPEDFFLILKCLKWLDMRNNMLTFIPRSVAHHSSLETLLLKDNKIEKLPVELGLVPRLRGLQLQGNPLSFPPPEVVAEGVGAVRRFLRKEWQREELPPNISPSDGRPAVVTVATGSAKVSGFRRNAPTRNVRTQARNSFHLVVEDITPELPEGQEGLPNIDPKGNSKKAENAKGSKTVKGPKRNLYKKSSRVKTGEESIMNKLLKDVWTTKLAEYLQRQEKVIERRKSLEALKTWRKDCRHGRKISNGEYEFTAPYYLDLPRKPKHGRNRLALIRTRRLVADEMAAVADALKVLNAGGLLRDMGLDDVAEAAEAVEAGEGRAEESREEAVMKAKPAGTGPIEGTSELARRVAALSLLQKKLKALKTATLANKSHITEVVKAEEGEEDQVVEGSGKSSAT